MKLPEVKKLLKIKSPIVASAISTGLVAATAVSMLFVPVNSLALTPDEQANPTYVSSSIASSLGLTDGGPTEVSDFVDSVMTRAMDDILTAPTPDDIGMITKKVGNTIASEVDGYRFQQATVAKIINGETIIVDVHGEDYTVKLLGVNTFEEKAGEPAASFVNSILKENDVIYLEKDVQTQNAFGHELRYVWLEVPSEMSPSEMKDKMLNAMLLDNGYAIPQTIQPNQAHACNLAKIAYDAGVWAPSQETAESLQEAADYVDYF